MLNNDAYETQSTVCYSAEVAGVDPNLGLYNKHGTGNTQPMLFMLAGPLTHWGRVTHVCVSEIIIIGPDNGLSPGRRQAIIWTNAGILLIGP